MEQSTGYGDGFGSRLRAKATAFVSRSLRNTNIAVTEIRSNNPEHGVSSPLTREDAYLIGFNLVDYPIHEYFEDDRAAPVTYIRAGQTILYDLKRNPRFTINKACHCVHFYFPRAALNLIADNAEAARIDELRYQPGAGVDDSIMRSLVASLMPAFESPDQASRIFVEHITMAVGVHAAKTYGGMRPAAHPSRGGLAPWQMKRVKDTLSADLEGEVSLGDLANDCGISVSHFSRAFRQSTGLSPHQWLLLHRVDRAKALLRDRALSLLDVALSCGFADQSHFSRVFTRIVGISPGAWRRNLD